MRRLIASMVVFAGIASLALGLAGCTKKLTGTTSNTDVPHTTIFVQGPVDTVNHVAHLYWYGTEAHGYIVGYQVRMVNPADTVAADSAWHYTTKTDSVVTVWTPSGYARPVFYARAIDTRGVVDPNPAKQTFQFNNNPPIVTLVLKPNHADFSDSTFASVTVSWAVSDPDGNASKTTTHIWLDRMPGPPLLVTGTSYTVPSENFKINGVYTSERRTLYIQGVDDGGMAGPIDSVTWFVRKPVTGTRARLLIIDDCGADSQGKPLPPNAANDSVYIRAARAAGVPTSQMTYIWRYKNRAFKSDADIYQTMKLFEAVVWFRGLQTSVSGSISTDIANYSGGIGQYLDGGGKLYLETQSMVAGLSSQGDLGPAFVNRYLDCDGVFQYGSLPDSSADYAIGPPNTKLCWGSRPDTLVCTSNVGFLRGFLVRHASQILLYAPPGNLTGPSGTPAPRNPIPMPVGIVTSQSNGGVLIANTFPLIAGGGLAPAVTVATNVMHILGLDVP